MDHATLDYFSQKNATLDYYFFVMMDYATLDYFSQKNATLDYYFFVMEFFGLAYLWAFVVLF